MQRLLRVHQLGSCAQAHRRGFLGPFPLFPAPGIEAVVGSVTDLGFLDDGTVDFAFASNVFEHLRQEDLVTVLEALRRKLAPSGTLTILQPNYRFAYREYFDDYTHIAVYSHVSLCDFLIANGYEIFDAKPRFLPLTIKSRPPVSPLLIRAYLASPFKPGKADVDPCTAAALKPAGCWKGTTLYSHDWLARAALAAFLAVLARAGHVVLVAIEESGFRSTWTMGRGSSSSRPS